MPFSIGITSGSNVDYEWLINDQVDCFPEYPDLKTFTASHTLPADFYTVDLFAENILGSEQSSFELETMYPLDSKYVKIYKTRSTIQPGGTIYFKVRIKTSYPYPKYGDIYYRHADFGEIKCTSNFGDGSAVENHDLFLSTVDLYSGYSIPHIYEHDANYTVSISCNNQISSIEKTIIVPVWETLAVYMEVPKVAIRVDESITFTVANPPQHGFMYRFEFGDGHYVEFLNDTVVYQVCTHFIIPSQSCIYTIKK